jgi:hypothetical protein
MITPKQIMYIAGGIAVFVLALIVNNWRLDSNRLPLVEKERDDANATVAQIKADAKIVADASAGFQSELALLRERNLGRPNTPVRLCRAAPAAGVRVPSAEPGPDGGASGAGLVSDDAGVHPGPDIGPQLRALADRADTVTAQGRGLQKAADGLAPD